MDNVLETQGVPLVVFGGAVPELAPEDLPEGASPFNQDVDFNPGSVFTRGGRINQYTYQNFIVTDNPRLGQTLPGAFAPNETPWLTPNNITGDIAGTYASVLLNQSQNSTVIVQVNQLFSNTLGTTFVGSFNAPVTAGNTVVVFLFVNDPNASVSEQPMLSTCVDQLGQGADHIGNTYPGSNYGVITPDAGFFAVQKSALGGGQTYTCTMIKFNGGGALPSACRFSMCLVEVTGTANLLGADPVVQAYGATQQSGASSFGSVTNLATVTNNCLILGVVQIDNNPVQTAYLIPGPTSPTAGVGIINIAEYFIATTGYYRDQFLCGKILLSPFASATVTYATCSAFLTPASATASIVLQMAGPPVLGKPGITSFPDQVGASNSGGLNVTTITYPTVISARQEVMYAITALSIGALQGPTLGAGLGFFDTRYGFSGGYWTQTILQPNVAFTGSIATSFGAGAFCTAVFVVPFSGLTVPAVINDCNIVSGALGSGTTYPANFVLTLSPGSTIFVILQGDASAVPTNVTASNSKGDVFTTIATASGAISGGGNVSVWVLMAQNIVGGNTDIAVRVFGTGTSGQIVAVEVLTGVPFFAPQIHSQILQGSQYGPGSVPTTDSVLGMEVLLAGHQSIISDPSVNLAVTLNVPGSQTITKQLPISDGVVVFGTPTSQWGVALTPAIVNNQGFGVQVVANAPFLEAANFFVYGLQIKLFLTPNPPVNFNWVKTYEQTDTEVDTLALDAAGVLWDEDVDTNPAVFNSIFNTILPNTFAKSVTFADIEYIAFSNLLNGTDVPRQWNGTNLDRISMVGPGAKPNASGAGTGAGGSGNVPIQQISQAAPTQIRRIAFGTAGSPQDSTPGNLLVIYGEGKTPSSPYSTLPPYTPTFGTGTTVVLSAITNPFPRKDGGTLPYNLNGSYTVGGVSMQTIGGSEQCPTFDLPSPTTTWAYSADYGIGGTPTSGWFYQSCIATMIMQQPLPNVGVGSSIQVTGTGGGPPSGYDGNWQVLQAPNTVQMTINSASLTGGSAQFSYTLVPPSPAPQPGQTVTITNCLNGFPGTDPNIFNRTANIASVGGGNFTVAISNSPDIPSQAQTGAPPATAVVAGTTFTFDAGAIITGGTSSGGQTGIIAGGSVVQQGQIISGQRKVCYSFLTRSGFITQPSPIYTFSVTGNGTAITVTNLSPGPPNVIARIVFFTGSGGGNFFWIPQDVQVIVAGVTQNNTKTIINDNTTTTATFTFSDVVLLTGLAIDITGNNLFNCLELGSSRGLLTYASRMIAWGEQLKITNLRNLSFDGGYSGNSSGAFVPLGWTIDPANGTGGTLLFFSPVFGWCYQITNSSGITQTSYGMITQPAWQDEFQVPIVQAATLYSVRITAATSGTPIASGNLIVDLFDTGSNIQLGVFSLPLSSLTATMQIFTGTLLTRVLQPVPQGLTIRIWAQNVPTASTILIDRVEPFQTLVPVNSTALKMSYVNNQESFDQITGVSGPAQNMQPINGAMELFDLLYALKEKSWFSTSDNGVTEPNKWNWKTVSNKVGTIGQNAFDWGEGWALTADREGVHFFEGGEPIKISQELQPLWDAINWTYGYTLWLRNDPEQKRFTVGVPIATPNQWMPEFPANANPTTPNVILMCNYRELNTGAAMSQTSPIRSTYMGRLMSPEPARKWSFWNILCPYSDFVSRNNNNWPQFYCTGYGDSKMFTLQASQLQDDGVAINSFWVSYGFTKAEMQDAKGLGLFRMTFPYLTVLAIGSGTLNTFVYPETPFNQPPYTLDILPLPALSQGDLELGVNIKGNRFFIRVGTNAVGSAFRLSKLVVPLIPDTWSPIRGWNAVTA